MCIKYVCPVSVLSRGATLPSLASSCTYMPWIDITYVQTHDVVSKSQHQSKLEGFEDLWTATTLKTATSPGTKPMRFAMILDATKTAVGAQKLVTPEAWHKAELNIEIYRNKTRNHPDISGYLGTTAVSCFMLKCILWLWLFYLSGDCLSWETSRSNDWKVSSTS